MKLSAKRVAKLLQKPGRHGDGDGLYLQVSRPGRGSWLLRYERDGRERAMGLGALVDFTLAEARQRARAARQLLTDGVDPLDQRRSKRDQARLEAAKNVTFKQCAELYFNAHADQWTNVRHRQQFTASMRDHVYPIIGSMPVAAVDEALVLKVLTPIWKTKTTTAKRVRNRIAAVLDYAAASKYRSGSNPARWEGHLEHLLAAPEKIAAVKHHPALPHSEVANFIAELRNIEGVTARALEFCILAAARTNEVSEAVWDEINFEERAWIIPRERMKAAREHRVPLSDRAIEILRQLPREAGNPYVFIGSRRYNIGPTKMLRLLRTIRDDIVVHGFRSSFSDWAHEQTGFDNHTIELSLAHSIGNAAEQAYRRSDLLDKRRRLMQAWSVYCTTPKSETAAVVPMRGHHA